MNRFCFILMFPLFLGCAEESLPFESIGLNTEGFTAVNKDSLIAVFQEACCTASDPVQQNIINQIIPRLDRIQHATYDPAHGYFLFQLDKGDWLFDNSKSGNVLLLHPPLSARLQPLLIKVDGFIKEQDWYPSIPVPVESLLYNHWDIDHEQLRGQILLLPPKDIHAGMVSYGMVYFNLNDQEIKYFYDANLAESGYYTETGINADYVLWKSPVKRGAISSVFSDHRMHPITNEIKAHYGTDYAGTLGDPVYSIGFGYIDKYGEDENNGIYVKIRHTGGYASQYLHLQSLSSSICKDCYVDKGQIIGGMGMTGLATGPHVCFRFWKDGRQVDPYHLKVMREVKPDRMSIWRKRIMEYYEGELKEIQNLNNNIIISIL